MLLEVAAVLGAIAVAFIVAIRLLVVLARTGVVKTLNNVSLGSLQ